MRKLVLASTSAIALLGLAACSDTDETTTQSVPAAEDQVQTPQENPAATPQEAVPATDGSTTQSIGTPATEENIDAGTGTAAGIDRMPDRPASSSGGPAPGGADGDQPLVEPNATP